MLQTYSSKLLKKLVSCKTTSSIDWHNTATECDTRLQAPMKKQCYNLRIIQHCRNRHSKTKHQNQVTYCIHNYLTESLGASKSASPTIFCSPLFTKQYWVHLMRTGQNFSSPLQHHHSLYFSTFRRNFQIECLCIWWLRFPGIILPSSANELSSRQKCQPIILPNMLCNAITFYDNLDKHRTDQDSRVDHWTTGNWKQPS